MAAQTRAWIEAMPGRDPARAEIARGQRFTVSLEPPLGRRTIRGRHRCRARLRVTPRATKARTRAVALPPQVRVRAPTNDQAVRAAKSACPARRGTSRRADTHRPANGAATPARAAVARTTTVRPTAVATAADDRRHPLTVRTADRHRATAADPTAGPLPRRPPPMIAGPTGAPLPATAGGASSRPAPPLGGGPIAGGP